MTEAVFQAAVVETAKLMRWRAFHDHDSRRSEPGFPDLCLVHPERGIVFAELKTDTGRVGNAQVDWLEALQAAAAVRPARARLWRPSSWPEIEAVLRGRA